MSVIAMTLCIGRPHSPCVFSVDFLGAPSWVRPPKILCVFCDRAQLEHLLADGNGNDEVPRALARLLTVDQEIFKSALRRLPASSRRNAATAAIQIAMKLIPANRKTANQQRSLLLTIAGHTLLRGIAHAPAMARACQRANADLYKVRILRARWALPSAVVEILAEYMGGMNLGVMHRDIRAVKQHGYNIGHSPLFWPRASTRSEFTRKQRTLIRAYVFALRVHRGAMQEVKRATRQLTATAETAEAMTTASLSHAVWVLLRMMS